MIRYTNTGKLPAPGGWVQAERVTDLRGRPRYSVREWLKGEEHPFAVSTFDRADDADIAVRKLKRNGVKARTPFTVVAKS